MELAGSVISWDENEVQCELLINGMVLTLPVEKFKGLSLFCGLPFTLELTDNYGVLDRDPIVNKIALENIYKLIDRL